VASVVLVNFPKNLILALAKDYARAYFKRRTEKALFTRFEDRVMRLAEQIYKTKYVDPLDAKEAKMAKKKATKKMPVKKGK
jgi:hypothetical protein